MLCKTRLESLRTLAPLLAGALLAVTVAALPAAADTFTVNNAGDTDDGSCDEAPDDCTLREAIDASNANSGRDTIEFDPTVFIKGSPTLIDVLSALPFSDDPDGLTIDGYDAGVTLTGAGLVGGEHGLVFESGAGESLSNVVVGGIRVQNFPGNGILVCGGAVPECDENVSRVQIEGVTSTENGDNGIVVDGARNDRTEIAYVTASNNDSRGINLNSSLNNPLNRASVMYSTASGNDSTGINLNASGDNIDSTVSGCTTVGNDSTGININAGALTTGAELSNNVSSRNGSTGINVNAGENLERVKFSHNTATSNDGNGINANAGARMRVIRLMHNITTANDSSGINVNAADDISGARVNDNKSVANDSDGINLNSGSDDVRAMVRDNYSVGNDGFGLRLAGTRNDVRGNRANNNDAGIRLGGSGDRNSIRNNQAVENTTFGIFVADGSTNNRIRGNDARLNGDDDLIDDNLDCDENRWQDNMFETSNASCIE